MHRQDLQIQIFSLFHEKESEAMLRVVARYYIIYNNLKISIN